MTRKVGREPVSDRTRHSDPMFFCMKVTNAKNDRWPGEMHYDGDGADDNDEGHDNDDGDFPLMHGILTVENALSA